MLLNCGVGEDSWESLNPSWIFIGRTDAEAEVPILWQPDAKNWLTGKDTDAGKDWKQEEKGPTEDEMVQWHHWLNGHEFEQALGVGDGQGSLVCYSPWGCKESDMTERLNWWCVLLCEVKSLSPVWSLWPHGHQAPPPMGFSRQEYWSGLPFPSPGSFPTQGSNPGLPHCRQTL